MQINTGNFTIYFSSNVPVEPSTLVKKSLERSSNCQGWIKTYSNRYLYVYIDKNVLSEFLYAIGKTLDEYLLDISGFIYNNNIIPYYNYNTTSNLDIDSTWKSSSSVIFEFDLELYNNHPKLRYYAYCLIRHIYYYQDVMTRYYYFINNTDEELTLATKVKLLSLSSSYASCHSLYQTVVTKLTDNNSLLTRFCEYGNATTSDSRYTIYRTGTSVGNEQLLKEVVGLDELLEKYTNTQYYIANVKIDNIPFIKDRNGYYMYEKAAIGEKYNIVRKVTNSFSVSPPLNDAFYLYNYTGYYITKSNLVKKVVPKSITVDIKSRHPSHKIFRNTLLSSKKVLIRLGSTTTSTKEYDFEINSIAAINTSSNKKLMKRAFVSQNITTPTFWETDGKTFYNATSEATINDLPYPIVAKNIYGSRGTGNYKLDSAEQLSTFIKRRTNSLENYIFEEFLNYNKEYRIHVSINGVFLMWRKLRRNDTPQNQKWFFNNQNCNWVNINHELFDVPNNMNTITAECMKALKSVGLTVGACDIRVENNIYKSGKTKSNPNFAIIEINSAPSMGEQTGKVYIDEFNKIISKVCAD